LIREHIVRLFIELRRVSVDDLEITRVVSMPWPREVGPQSRLDDRRPVSSNLDTAVQGS
jgi:hypothetical protein